MKKRLLCALSFCLSASLFANYQCGINGPDGALFLDPHVQALAQQSSAVSINIGSHLPSTTHIITAEMCKEIGIGAHFKTMAQKLEENAPVVVATPASYGVVFTNATASEDSVHQHIDHVLAQIGESTDPAVISSHLNQLNEVYRATFVFRDGKLSLVRDEKDLHLGEQVWRKTPEGVEPQIYHSEEEYMVAFANAGFSVVEVKRPCFYGEVKYKMHRTSLAEGEKGLGRAYIENHPFTIFYLVKR